MGWRLVDVDIHKVIKKLLHSFIHVFVENEKRAPFAYAKETRFFSDVFS